MAAIALCLDGAFVFSQSGNGIFYSRAIQQLDDPERLNDGGTFSVCILTSSNTRSDREDCVREHKSRFTEQQQSEMY